MSMTTLDDLDAFAGETVDAETGEIEPLPEYQPTNRHSLTMPPEVARAIIEVAGQVKSLPKLERNEYGKYPYVSVDAFYAAIGPLMATAGLLLVTDENEVVTIERKSATWLRIRYELMLYHTSGAAYGPIHRTMLVQAAGAQAFGAAISYAEKYYLRGLFRVPTGEQDADADKPEDLPPTLPKTKRAGPFSRNQPPPEPIPPATAANSTQQQLTADNSDPLRPPAGMGDQLQIDKLMNTLTEKTAVNRDEAKAWFRSLPPHDRDALRARLEARN